MRFFFAADAMNRVPTGRCFGQSAVVSGKPQVVVGKILGKVRPEAVRVLPVLHFVPLVCEP